MKIDGREIAQNILSNLKRRVETLKKKGITPHLVIILVGHDPASEAYVKQKAQKGEAIGIKVTVKNYQLSTTNYQLLEAIKQFNNDSNVHGIIVQQPLPPQIDVSAIINAVDPQKDVDGFHPQTKFPMPLAVAVLKILEEVSFSNTSTFIKWLGGKKIVIIGKGETGGGPIIKRLKELGIKTIVIDSKTPNPHELTKTADIIISSVGKPNIVKESAIKNGVILISVGLHKGEDGKLHGDYEEEEIADIAGFYTPTPGGVGPVNVACLLENLVTATEK